MTLPTLLTLFIALPLGTIFLASALPKLRHPQGFVLIVQQYEVLPSVVGQFYGYLLPILELFVALLLVSGVAIHLVVLFVLVLFVSFMVAISVNLARGRVLDCGCFGPGRRRIGWRLVIEDGVLLVLALTLYLVTSEGQMITTWSPVAALTAQETAANPFIWWLGIAVCGAVLLIKMGIRSQSHSHNPELVQIKDQTFPEQDTLPQVILPDQQIETLNGCGTVNLSKAKDENGLLLVFLTPLCASCQRLVASLNALKQDALVRSAVIIVLQSEERTAYTFLKVFPLLYPTVCDDRGMLVKEFDLHQMPSALLFNQHGRLLRREHPVTSELELMAFMREIVSQ